MTKYIDADRLRKEVRRLEKVAHKSALSCADRETRRFHEGKDFAYQYVGAIIASLQQEQPEVDLEKEIKDTCRSYWINDYHEQELGKHDIENIARHFAQWGVEHLKK